MRTQESPSTPTETTLRDAAQLIMVIDSDDLVRASLTERLEREGFRVVQHRTGLGVVELIERTRPDLIVLEIRLPEVDGLTVLSSIRQRSDVPVVVLSTFGEEADRVIGLELGADDYVSKPHSLREVIARIRAILQRSPRIVGVENDLDFGRLVIRRRAREVLVDGDHKKLTSREFELLLHLARSPRQVHSREELLDAVWNSSGQWQSLATVTEHVRRLRSKLDVDGAGPWISTVWGIGYRFDA